jgi:hypothetical protein
VYGVQEAHTLRVTTDTVVSASLPPQLDGTRVVFLADVHAGPYFGPERMDDLVRQVNALDADVLILGGDYVGGRMRGARVFYPRAGGFRARVAKLAVLGNHDNWEGSETAKQGLAEAGFRLLDNDSTRITARGASFAVAGVEDLETGNPDPQAAAGGIDPDSFAILVSHNPDTFTDHLGDTAGDWDLGLAGHTHGGQIGLGGLTQRASGTASRTRSGWMTENGVRLLVTRGVGTVTLPVRVSAQPEIHVITLRSAP